MPPSPGASCAVHCIVVASWKAAAVKLPCTYQRGRGNTQMCYVADVQGNEYWSAGNQILQYDMNKLPRNQPQPHCSASNCSPVPQCPTNQCASPGCGNINLLTDVANCGACGNACPAPASLPKVGTGGVACSNGTCTITACAAGWVWDVRRLSYASCCVCV
jgi:hypothetical protein